MLKINPHVGIPESELSEQFVRASGPGGQNVNKVATAVRLRFNVRHTAALPADARLRLAALAGARLATNGDLVIVAQRFRTQAQNRSDARTRLAALIRAALHKPKPRRKTKISAGAKQRRRVDKQRRSRIKHARTATPAED